MQQRHTGLYQKYAVNRHDCRDLPGGDRHGADYFVLDTTFDRYAPAALLAYAAACARHYPQLAQDLIQRAFAPVPIIRDDQGCWTHPANPISYDDSLHPQAWLAQYGYQAGISWMERDATLDEMDIYDATGSCKHWQPTPPDGQGWQLFAITDTDDGPGAGHPGRPKNPDTARDKAASYTSCICIA